MTELFSLRGKSALVTGGSRGMGLMIARGLVSAGVTVYISSRKKDACLDAAREMGEFGECVALPADLSSEEGCSDLAAALTDLTPDLDILVNNAGAIWSEPLKSFPAAAWDKVLDVNLKAPFFLVQHLLPLLEAAATADDPSRVINIGSIYGIKSSGSQTYSYSASKAALHHLTRVLAAELGPSHITVNAIAPGPFASRMYVAEADPWNGHDSRPPISRLGRSDDIVGATQYLASRAAAYVTGVVLPVDGGRSTAV